jgi:hypothetical protein
MERKVMVPQSRIFAQIKRARTGYTEREKTKRYLKTIVAKGGERKTNREEWQGEDEVREPVEDHRKERRDGGGRIGLLSIPSLSCLGI